MVGEKENKSKEGMKIMGLKESIYFLSYFIQYIVINLFDSVINTILLSWIFTKIPFYFKNTFLFYIFNSISMESRSLCFNIFFSIFYR